MPAKPVPTQNAIRESEPVDGVHWLIRSKLAPPFRGDAVIDRPRLADELLGARPKRVTLVTAPPGYGKTTLATQWTDRLRAGGSTVVWLGLDEDDDEPATLLAYLAAALEVSDVSAGTLAQAIQRGQYGLSSKPALGAVLHALDRVRGPVMIVLEDLHRIRSAQVLAVLDSLIERMPDNTRLCLTQPDAPGAAPGRAARAGQPGDHRRRRPAVHPAGGAQLSGRGAGRRSGAADPAGQRRLAGGAAAGAPAPAKRRQRAVGGAVHGRQFRACRISGRAGAGHAGGRPARRVAADLGAGSRHRPADRPSDRHRRRCRPAGPAARRQPVPDADRPRTRLVPVSSAVRAFPARTSGPDRSRRAGGAAPCQCCLVLRTRAAAGRGAARAGIRRRGPDLDDPGTVGRLADRAARRADAGAGVSRPFSGDRRAFAAPADRADLLDDPGHPRRRRRTRLQPAGRKRRRRRCRKPARGARRPAVHPAADPRAWCRADASGRGRGDGAGDGRSAAGRSGHPRHRRRDDGDGAVLGRRFRPGLGSGQCRRACLPPCRHAVGRDLLPRRGGDGALGIRALDEARGCFAKAGQLVAGLHGGDGQRMSAPQVFLAALGYEQGDDGAGIGMRAALDAIEDGESWLELFRFAYALAIATATAAETGMLLRRAERLAGRAGLANLEIFAASAALRRAASDGRVADAQELLALPCLRLPDPAAGPVDWRIDSERTGACIDAALLLGQAEPARALIVAQLAVAQARDQQRLLARLQVQMAVLELRGGNDAVAVRALQAAMAAAQPGHMLRPFLDHAEAVRALLQRMRPFAGDTRLETFRQVLQQALRPRPDEGDSDVLLRLSPREQEVLRLIAEGQTSKEAARQLGVSVNTVMTHRKNLYRKLDASTRARVIAAARSIGLIS